MKYLVGLINVAPLWYLSFCLLWTWVDPMSFREGAWIKFGVGLLVMEFILVHSGVFITGIDVKVFQNNPLRYKLMVVGLYLFFYLPFALALAYILQSIEMLVIFTLVMLSRFSGILYDPNYDQSVVKKRSAISAGLYLALVSFSLFVPIPQWGITPEVIDQVYTRRGNGVWEAEPQRAIVAAVIYFFVIGVFELRAVWKKYKVD